MNIKSYIINEIIKILDVNTNISVEIPPKREMGDFSVQCASLRNEKYNNPIQIALLIKDNFNDTDNFFTNGLKK